MHTKGVRPISTAIVADTTPNRRNTADDVGRWPLQTALEGFDCVRGSESGIAHGRAMVKDRLAGLNAMQWGNARCAQGVEPGH